MASHGTCATAMVIQVMLAITRERGAKMKGHKIDGVYRHWRRQFHTNAKNIMTSGAVVILVSVIG